MDFVLKYLQFEFNRQISSIKNCAWKICDRVCVHISYCIRLHIYVCICMYIYMLVTWLTGMKTNNTNTNDSIIKTITQIDCKNIFKTPSKTFTTLCQLYC